MQYAIALGRHVALARHHQRRNAPVTECAGAGGVLIGPEHVVRIDVPKEVSTIELDDWRSAVAHLPEPANAAVQTSRDRIAEKFLYEPAAPCVPVVLTASR